MAKKTKVNSTKPIRKPVRTSKLAKANSQKKSSKTSSPEWPVTRNVMFRPDRKNYVRRLIRSEGCVFCHAFDIGAKAESLVLCIHGEAVMMLNKYPYNSGHILVLPKRHCGDFTDLTAEESSDIQKLLKVAVKVLGEVYRPGGFNMGLNLGSVAGAGIPEHLHWHVLPRWAGDANFYPLIAETKVVIETLEQTYERLVPLLEAQGVRP